MKLNPDYNANFYEGGIFHVYNRTNNKELLFRSDENSVYFLKKYEMYLQPFVDTFCWSLLPNHFHFLIRIKSANDILHYLERQPLVLLKKTEQKYLRGKATVDQLIEFEFKRFFISYSKSFNTLYNRSGNLFHRPFKRVEVNKESHFTQAIIYIHANAQRHKLCNDFTKYPWSSWHTMISNEPTQLCRAEVLDWFGGLKPFIDAHKGLIEYYYDCNCAIEEDYN